MKNIILKTVNKQKQERFKQLEQGMSESELLETDYLSTYDILLKKGYSKNEIVKSLFDVFSLKSIDFHSLNELKLNECKILLSSMYEILEDDYKLVESILEIFILAISKNTQPFIDEYEALQQHSEFFNRVVQDDCYTFCQECKNNIQKLGITVKSYLDFCEGSFSNALSLLVFHLDIIKSKKRTLEQVSKLSEADKLNIIKSYSNTLYDEILMGYSKIIRNSAAHKSYRIDIWPNLIFSNISKSRGEEKVNITYDELIYKTNKIYSISNVIYTAYALEGLDEQFLKATRECLTEKSMNETFEMLETLRKHCR